MNLLDAFRESCVRIARGLSTKDEVLQTIADIVEESNLLPAYDSAKIFEELKSREEIGTTGFENGIAIPHCAVGKAEEFIAGILLVPDGVDFQSADGKPSYIFAFIVGPEGERNRHIQLLSALSRMLMDAQTAEKFRNATSEEDLWLLLTRYIGEMEGVAAPAEPKPKNLFTIVIQREEYFDDILQIFSAAVNGSLTVLDATNAGHYLHRIPLFASYWSEPQSKFNRVIIAVVDRDVSNDVVRRINTRVAGISDNPGVLLTVSELSYANGLIEF